MLVQTIEPQSKKIFQLNYVPEKLIFRADDVTRQLTGTVGVKVTPLGDGVLADLDPKGVDTIDSINKIGGYHGSGALYIMELLLADGIVPDRVTDYEIENLHATDNLKVYAPVSKRATTYIQSMQQTLLANSQFVFNKFSFLGFEISDEDSQCTVDFEDGSSHTFSFNELSSYSTKVSSEELPVVYNLDGRVRKVTVIPSEQQKAYLTRYKALSNL